MTLLAGSLALAACSSGTGGHGQGVTGEINATLDHFVPDTVTGYSFVMVTADATLDAHAAGSMSLDRAVFIASASKAPAAAAILTLVDHGKLNLDTKVGEYLSSMGVSWPSSKSAITLKMLLDHTSGLPGLYSSDQPACIDVTNKDAADTETMQQCVQDIADSTLDAEPGTKFIYGGAGYQVAGYIAYRIAGAASWQAFFKQALADPLGATSLAYVDSQSNPRVAGGAQSTAPDYARFLQMLLNGGTYNGEQILSPRSAAALGTNQLGKNQLGRIPVQAPPGTDGSRIAGYSFGFFQDAEKIYTPSPGPEFSDQGLFGSTPWIDYGLHYAAVLLLPFTSTYQDGTDMWDAIHADTVRLAQK